MPDPVIHEVMVLSGKGGAGKTSIMAGLAHTAHARGVNGLVLCDLDVDAPDLHLVLSPRDSRVTDFHSGNEAIINPELCTACGTCYEHCRFGAIIPGKSSYRISPLHCEGCKVCVTLCPEHAVDFPVRHCGTWSKSFSRFGPMIHAQLFPGEENSGRLVALLKREAREMAEKNGGGLILGDGAPGIGCPVIASLAGVDLAVLVTEPTPSGLHDLKRVAELCKGFRTRVGVIINKHDINPDQTGMIEDFCREKGYPVLCRLPHDQVVVEAMVRERAVTEIDTAFRDALSQAWDRITVLLDED